jgi:hypothetical protein
MEDQPTIKLKIPRQDLAEFSLFQPNTESAASWVQNLPVTNTNSLVQMLVQALSDLNRTPLSPEARYNILEILRPNLDVAQSNLSKRFLNQPLVMPEAPRAIAEVSDRLLTLSTTAYTVVAIEAIQKREAIRDINPARLTCQAIQRALVFAGRKVLQNFQLHRPMEIHGWRTLHQLYTLARHQGLADLPVPEPLSGGSTITTTYLQAIMVSCCKPNQLRQGDLAALHRGLQQWSELIVLDSKSAEDNLFTIDLDSDQPPLYSAFYQEQPTQNCLYINCTALVDHLTTLKTETGDKGISFDKNTNVPSSLLDHLITALGNVSLRNFKRTVSSSPLWICLGLSSTHYHVAGNRLFEQLLYNNQQQPDETTSITGNPFTASRKERDIWQTANPGQDYESDESSFDLQRAIDIDTVSRTKMLEEDDSQLPPNERYPISKVQLTDASPGGYCLEWTGDSPRDIKTGDIVGLKEQEGQKDWVIAVIRWLSRLDNAKTLIGLELLSPRAVAYGASIHRKGAEKTQPMRVLLLPEIKLVGQPHTLITPRTGFKERQKVTISNSAESHSIQLLRHIASMGGFEQFEFRYIKELGDVLAETQQGQSGIDYDSLWSNI